MFGAWLALLRTVVHEERSLANLQQSILVETHLRQNFIVVRLPVNVVLPEDAIGPEHRQVFRAEAATLIGVIEGAKTLTAELIDLRKSEALQFFERADFH